MMLQIGLTKKKVKKDLNKGFTLIELCVVSVIILVLISISTPLFRKTLTDLELREAVSRLEKFILFSQQEAIVNETIHKIVFDFENKKYRLYSEIGEGGNLEFSASKGKFGRIFNLPRSIDIEGDKDEILFYPDGHSGVAKLRLINKNDKVLELTVTGMMGNVIVTEQE